MIHTFSQTLVDRVQIASSASEIDELEQFRYTVYVQEQGKNVDGADHARRRLRLSSDDTARHYYLRSPDSAQILGYARGHLGTFPEHLEEPLQLWRFERFCDRRVLFLSSQLMVAPRARNLTVMRALTGAQYRDARRNGIRAWLCHCRSTLTPIYVRSGLRVYGPDFDLGNLGTQSPLIGICEDVEHFLSLKSYFYPLALEFDNNDDFRREFHREFPSQHPKEHNHESTDV